ncbi:acylneuraminate cytidylyltransferase family protein [Nitrosopumilus sp. S6]
MKISNLKIISIIPVRGGSKGIPMKNLKILNKKPLLYYTINNSLQSKYVDRTIVSTENDELSRYAKKIGAEVIPRPKKLSLDKSPTEPVMLHTLEFLKKNENYIPDVIILLQNTSPFRTVKHIDEAFDLFFKQRYDSVLSGVSSSELIWINKNKSSFPINYNPTKRPQRQNIKSIYFENGAIYITKYKNFLKSKCRISGKTGIFVMPKKNSIEIDEPHDLTQARKMIKQKLVKI